MGIDNVSTTVEHTCYVLPLIYLCTSTYMQCFDLLLGIRHAILMHLVEKRENARRTNPNGDKAHAHTPAFSLA